MITLKEAIQEFKDIKGSGSPGTHEYYKYICDIIEEAATDAGVIQTPITHIQTVDASRIMISIKENKEGRRSLGLTTLEKIRKCLKTLFNYYFRKGLISHNPAEDLPQIRCEPENSMPFSDHEVIALVSVIPQKLIQYRDKVIIQLLLDSGIRGGELINLRLKDWTGKSIHIKDGKGGKHRNVSVGITTAEAIDDYIQNYRVHHCDRLFTTQEGTEVKFGNLNDRIKEWQKLSNVEHASSHRFRATFATRFIKDKRGDIEQLRILLGHEDIATTKRYVHLTKEEEAQYANSHNSLVDQITRSPKNITEHGNTNLNTETDDNG